jgi:hypothetical protein
MGTTQQLATIERLVDLMGDMGNDVHPLRVLFESKGETHIQIILRICNELFEEPSKHGIIWTVKEIKSFIFRTYLKIEKNGGKTSEIRIRYLKEQNSIEGYYVCFSGPLAKNSGTGKLLLGQSYSGIRDIVAESLRGLLDEQK